MERHDPLRRLFLRPFAGVTQREPEIISAAVHPQTPTVVFLNRLRETESILSKRLKLLADPDCKILAKAARIYKMRLHVTMLEEVGFNRDRVIHIWEAIEALIRKYCGLTVHLLPEYESIAVAFGFVGQHSAAFGE